eukprot:jgi/Botrbrau1/23165/Bobra.0041s0016.1
MALLLGGDLRPTYLRDAVDEEGSGSSHCDGFQLKPGGQGVGAGMGALVMPKFGRVARVGSSRMTSSTASSQASREWMATSSGITCPEGHNEGSADLQGFTMAAREAAAEGLGTQGTVAIAADTIGTTQAPGEAPERERMGSMTAWQALADQVMAELEMEEGAEELLSEVERTPSTASTENADALPPTASGSLTDIIARPGGALYVQYELQKELGEGAFGKAILARRRRDGELFVVKKMHATTLTEKAREEMWNEVKVLANLSHPNVVKYYDCFADSDERLVIVMEYCDDGDPGFSTEKERWKPHP